MDGRRDRHAGETIMTDKLKEAALQAERAAFEAWWNDPASADNSKVYEVTPTTEIRRLCQDIAERAWQARAVLAQQDAQAVRSKFLANGTRFKMSFFQNEDGEGNTVPGTHVTCFEAFEDELDGRWVALVPAEDDCHLNAAPTPPAQRVMPTDLEIDLLRLKSRDTFDFACTLIEAYERKNAQPKTLPTPPAQQGEEFWPEPLSEFKEGQWWVAELDAIARSVNATDEQKRAVSVVHHLLASAAKAVAKPPAQRVMLTDEEIEETMRDYVNVENGLFKVHKALIEAYEKKNGIK